jgi:hypothetical protein
MCADLRVDKKGNWSPFTWKPPDYHPEDYYIEMGDLLSSSLLCQSGGCRIILQAISRICPEASKKAHLQGHEEDARVDLSYGRARANIHLFVKEGICPLYG